MKRLAVVAASIADFADEMRSSGVSRTWAVAIAAMAILSSVPAKAFGLRTHLYIGEQVLKDAADCRVSLAETEQKIPDDVCEALKRHPGAFLAGTIGPDAFPDIVIGQSYIHPGAKDGRKSADWFEILLQSAESDEEIAFAYGNLVHAAGDMFAHSYVNNYSGGVFEILEARHKDIELRHFILEKYIDQRLDFEIASEVMLEVPAHFVVETLIETSYFSDSFTFTPGGLIEALENPGSAAGEAFFSRLSSAKAASHAVLMYAALELARAARNDLPCDAAKAEVELVAAHRAYLIAEAQARAGAGIEDVALDLPAVPQAPDCKTVQQDGALDALMAELAARLADQIRQTEMLQTASDAIDQRSEFWDRLDRSLRSDLDKAYDRYVDAVEERNRKRALAAFANQWAREVELASEEYIEAGLQTALLMVENSRPHPPAMHERQPGTVHYDKWTECYLPVYFGQPFAAGRATCDRLDEMGMPMSLSLAATEAGMGKMPRNLAYRVLDFNRRLDTFFMRLAKIAGRMVAPSTVELLDEIYHPSRITRERINEVYHEGRNGQLEFECVSDWVDVDLGILPPEVGEGALANGPCREVASAARERFLDPQAFTPLVHSITMAKIALLNRNGVVRLARDLSQSDEVAAAIRLSQPIDWQPKKPRTNAGRYSVILDTPMSLDGSYQWQGIALPYPRRNSFDGSERGPASGYPSNREATDMTLDGIATNSRRNGFPYYQTLELRQRVFSQLFPLPFEGSILRRMEMLPPRYPFRPCAGDPFRPYSSDARFPLCRTSGS